MKVVFVSLILIAMSSAAHAGNTDIGSSTACKAVIAKNASSIKKQAKAIIRNFEAELDSQLDQAGEATLGMGSRQHFQTATMLLEDVRSLQQGGELTDTMQELCSGNLDIDISLKN